MVINDLLLKPAWPGFVTGKLSDLAGMIYLPLLLMGLLELMRASVARPWPVGGRAMASCVVVTVVVFGLAKISPTAARAYGDLMGWVRWPVVRPWRTVHVTHDLTDLITLPAAGLAYLDARRARPRVHGATPSADPPAPPNDPSYNTP